MHLREALDSDKLFLAEMCYDADKLYSAIMPGAFERQAYKYKNSELPQNYNIEIIEDNNKNIGFYAHANISENVLYIVGLYIHSNYYKQGYGRSIIDKIVGENHYEKIVLLVHKEAKWAIDFYKSVSFTQISSDKEEMIKVEENIAKYYIENTYMMLYESKSEKDELI